ncbi:MAG: class II aldolase/adducin family protein [Planctomycetota bacterium]|jgi:L-fuculose-phosphate aldolase
MTDDRYGPIRKEFKKIGHAIFLANLNNSHSGNMSFRVGDRLLITRRGSMLGFLSDADIVETGLEGNDSGVALASTEVDVHRAIYRGTSNLAVIHVHPLTAVALSILQDEIIPIDVEGSYYLRKIPVLGFEYGTSSKEMAEALPKALKSYKVVMVKSHGAFAAGYSLEEALHYAHMTENIAEIIYKVKALGGDLSKIQAPGFSEW